MARTARRRLDADFEANASGSTPARRRPGRRRRARRRGPAPAPRRRRRGVPSAAGRRWRRPAQPPRQDQRGDRREDAELDLRLAKLRVGRRDDPLAEGGELESAAEAATAHRCDARQRERDQVAEEGVELLEERRDLLGQVVLDARAVGEVRAGAGEEERPQTRRRAASPTARRNASIIARSRMLPADPPIVTRHHWPSSSFATETLSASIGTPRARILARFAPSGHGDGPQRCRLRIQLPRER